MFNCAYIQTSGKRIKNGEAAVLQQKWEIKPIAHEHTSVCIQSTVQRNLQFPLLFVKQVQENHSCSHKSKNYICNLHKLF